MTPIVQAIRLRLWLPLGIAALILVIQVALFVHDRDDTRRRAHAQALTESQALLLRLRRIIEIGGNESDPTAVEELIGSYWSIPEINWVIAYDGQGIVRYSNHLAWIGQAVASILPKESVIGHPPSPGDHAVRLDHDPETAHIRLRTPVRFGWQRDTLRRPNLGWLMIDYDHGHRLAQMIHRRYTVYLSQGLLLLSIALLAWWLLHRYIVRPIGRFNASAQQLAGGDFSARLHIQGRGELADMARSFNELAQRLAELWQQQRERERFLATTLHSIGDAVIVCDIDGRVTEMNPIAERLTGWPLGEAAGRPLDEVFDIVNAHTGQPAANPLHRVIEEGRIVGLANDTELRSRDGSRYQIADSAAPIRLSDDSPLLGAILVFRDVSEAYAAQAELENNLDRLEAFANALPDLGFILDDEGRYIEVFGGSPELLYQEKKRLLGHRLTEILPEPTAGRILETITRAIATGEPQELVFELDIDGRTLCFQGRCASMQRPVDGHAAVVWLSRDISAQRRNESRILHLAYHDELTGLLNRTAITERLEEELSRARRHASYGAVLFFDLDHFKDVNDSLGHQMGDEILRQVAQRCRQILRTEDLLARIAGDEFLVVLADLGGSPELAISETRVVAEKILHELSRPYRLDDHYINLSSSIGISLFPQDEEQTTGDLLKQADSAMYRAKTEGRRTIRYFTHEDQRQADRRFLINNALRQAMSNGELSLYLQPIVDAQGRCRSAEALMRWQHPELGTIPPNEFIPIAETTGTILKLGIWTLERACEIIKQIIERDHLGTFERLAINLSPAQFQQPDFADLVSETLRRHGQSAAHLKLELTEEILVSKPEVVNEAIRRLRERGVHFSIDDFGTGFSSLQYLTQLPLDALKIDRTFIANLFQSPRDATIVEAIIQLGHALQIEIIAEGVETEEQLRFLRAHDCDFYQGYHFARPMPVDEFLDWMTAEKRVNIREKRKDKRS